MFPLSRHLLTPPQARRYFLTAEKIEAPRALDIGLIHEVYMCVRVQHLVPFKQLSRPLLPR
jgi:enoyl-CoA hydratase/carnithine racemase